MKNINLKLNMVNDCNSVYSPKIRKIAKIFIVKGMGKPQIVHNSFVMIYMKSQLLKT